MQFMYVVYSQLPLSLAIISWLILSTAAEVGEEESEWVNQLTEAIICIRDKCGRKLCGKMDK